MKVTHPFNIRTRLSSFWMIAFLLSSFVGYHHGIAKETIQSFGHTAPQIQTLDQLATLTAFHCALPEAKGHLPYSRSLKDDFYKIFFDQIEQVGIKTISVATFDARDTAYKLSCECLNLCILSAKHHPPTLV